VKHRGEGLGGLWKSGYGWHLEVLFGVGLVLVVGSIDWSGDDFCGVECCQHFALSCKGLLELGAGARRGVQPLGNDWIVVAPVKRPGTDGMCNRSKIGSVTNGMKVGDAQASVGKREGGDWHDVILDRREAQDVGERSLDKIVELG